MIKLLGALFIIGACGSAGLKIGSVYSKRTQLFQVLQHGLKFLETEINYGATPLPLALKRTSMMLKGEGRILFQRSAEILQTSQGTLAYEAWEAGIEALKRVIPLTPWESDILSVFGFGLGNSDKEEQLKHLALTKEQLAMAEKNAEEARLKHQRMWQYMGFCLGAVIVLVLI